MGVVSDIERQLSRLRSREADDGTPDLRTSTMTHIVWCPPKWRPQARATLAGLLERHPQLHGVVLDLPQVMAGVAEEACRRGMANRMTGQPGDFFDRLPSADLYLLKFILHDWDDESCRRILSNIRRAMNPGARLIIVEMVADTVTLEASLMDIAMMFAFTGQERDERHFESLLSAAGLRTSRTVGLHHPYRLIEAAPV